jgi:hypothetical protein
MARPDFNLDTTHVLALLLQNRNHVDARAAGHA